MNASHAAYGLPEDSPEGSSGQGTATRRPAPLTVAICLILVAVACLGFGLTRRSVDEQERALLRNDARQASLYVSALVATQQSILATLGEAVTESGGSPAAFQARAASVAPAGASLVLVGRQDATYVVEAAVGPGFTPGQTLNPALNPTMDTARGVLRPGPVSFDGAMATVGYAIGPPLVPANLRIYEQFRYTPFTARAARGAPFADLQAALYGSPQHAKSALVLANTTSLPLKGQVVDVPVPVGTGSWYLAARAADPLVGRFAALAPFLILGMGLVVALTVAAMLDVLIRRRRDVERLVAERSTQLLSAQADLVATERELARLDEMERIARDMHRRVVQRLFAVGSHLQAASARHPSAAAQIQPIIDEVDATARELRTTIFGLTSGPTQEADPPAQVLIDVTEGAERGSSH